MKKKIAKVMPAAFGHLMLEFEDGVKQWVHRGDHEAHQPKPGDMWPPDGHEHGLRQHKRHRCDLSERDDDAKVLQILLPQQDRQEYTQSKNKQPDRGCRSPDGPYPALFSRGSSRIEE
jgi:hypothetical protein